MTLHEKQRKIKINHVVYGPSRPLLLLFPSRFPLAMAGQHADASNHLSENKYQEPQLHMASLLLGTLHKMFGTYLLLSKLN